MGPCAFPPCWKLMADGIEWYNRCMEYFIIIIRNELIDGLFFFFYLFVVFRRLLDRINKSIKAYRFKISQKLNNYFNLGKLDR